MTILYNRSLSAINAVFDAHYSKANNAIGVLANSGRLYFLEIEKPKPPATPPPSENDAPPPADDNTPSPTPTFGEHLLNLLQDPVNIVLLIGVFLIGTLIGILLLRGKIIPPQILEKIKPSRADDNKLTPANAEEPKKEEPKKEEPKKEEPKKEEPKKEESKKEEPKKEEPKKEEPKKEESKKEEPKKEEPKKEEPKKEEPKK